LVIAQALVMIEIRDKACVPMAQVSSGSSLVLA